MRNWNPKGSRQWFSRAERVMASGVSSPARLFKAVGGGPPAVMERAEGAYIWDVDGRRYLDYQAAYGPLVLGHAHPKVVEAVTRQMARGSVTGATHPTEVALAETLVAAVPGLDRLRFVSTGTEAVMSAIRLARAATGRLTVVKFRGAYHGHSDLMLVQAGSGASTVGVEDSGGIPAEVRAGVVGLPYNDIAAVDRFMESHGHRVAALLVEPVEGNFGLVDPVPGFLEALKRWADAAGAVLIFDEVITAFRFHYGAAAELVGVRPDLFCLGKTIGGGLAGAAYGGREDLMRLVAPEGSAYQAGTLAGNPLSSAAGLATLEVLREENPYPRMDGLGEALEAGLLAQAREHGVPVTINRRGGMFTLFFGPGAVVDYDTAMATDGEQFAAFYRACLAGGVYLAPSRLECWFVSAAHTADDVEETLVVTAEAFRQAARR
jgi:glutamate-1-semialdehyde 2,1-aminomutase